MTDTDIKTGYNEICRFLAAKKIKQALSGIRKLTTITGQGTFADHVDDLEQTYRFILKYTVDGVDDPERGKIYNRLVVSVFELADKLLEKLMTKFSPSFLYTKKRSFDFSPADIQGRDPASDVSLHRIVALFWHTLFIEKWTENERDFLSEFLQREGVIPEYKSLLATALTFSTLRIFDEGKLDMLLDLYERFREDELISQRCLTGFLLALYQYSDRIEFYPLTEARLDTMTEDATFVRNAERIMLQLLASRETEKITQKIREEIIPEMIRISPNIRNKLNFENLMGEGESDDRNPEWSELFSESPGLLDKMEELAKMQIQGADVFLSSFAMLKSFPFFNEFTNWFIPFIPDHPEISRLTDQYQGGTETKIIGSLLNSPFLCNSDKYSFAFMLQHLTGEARAMMAGVLKAEMEQMEDIQKDEELLDPGRKNEIVSNQYIHDLYRFFRLHPSKNAFDDIFAWKYDFHNKRGFRLIMEKNQAVIDKMAVFYFEKKYYQEALEIFGRSDIQDAEKLQKEAYCYQKLGNWEKALSLYLKAELYDVNKIWNLKKIALCYRNLKMPEEALRIYQSIDTLEPENLNTTYAIGYCFSETGRYQDALNSFFKIEYLAPGNKKVWKPIAWSSFLTGKTDQAEKYYKKLVDEDPDKYDLMNMGHVQWALGRRRSALEYYRQSIITAVFSVENFMTAFKEDLPALLAQGIREDEVPIMLDELRYSLGDQA